MHPDNFPPDPLKKPKSPDLPRKSSFSSIKPLLSLTHPRTWLILTVLSLQILLLFMVRSLPPSTTVKHLLNDAVQCPYGKVYVYTLPEVFNSELLQKCHELNPWGSQCETFSNNGFGPAAGTQLSTLVPDNLSGTWYWTDQFALEIIYHNRILNHRCRTKDAGSATAYYVPSYVGLAVGKYLWKNFGYGPEDRDRHCVALLTWIRSQPYWQKSGGRNHFLAMGRITWDFRREKIGGWGSKCIYMRGMRNVTRLLIERDMWDYLDVGVPYPTGFHPGSPSDIVTWQDYVRTRERSKLFCFAGATRGFIKNDFRGVLLSQCYDASGSCQVVDCGGKMCSNGTSEVLSTFLHSDFCLQPRGDSFTRKSIFDCMIAGSIPVFFWKRTAYYQYQWFLPGDPESYSVFIDRNEVKKGMSIKAELEKIDKKRVNKMREKVIEYIPNIVYVKPNEGLVGVKDAFDIAIDGVLKRMKEQKGGYLW